MYVSRKTCLIVGKNSHVVRIQEISKAKFIQLWEGDRAADRLDAWRHQRRSSERDVAMRATGGDVTGLASVPSGDGSSRGPAGDRGGAEHAFTMTELVRRVLKQICYENFSDKLVSIKSIGVDGFNDFGAVKEQTASVPLYVLAEKYN
jgi:hypothetical protein